MTTLAPPQIGVTTLAARTRPWLTTSAVAISGGVLTFVVLHLLDSRNPLVDAVSFYAFAEQAPGFLAVSMLLVATGSATALGALAAARVPISRTTRVLFGSWSGGLALAAAFPVSSSEFPNPVSGEIHQYSCVVAFLSVPALGFSLLDRTRAIAALSRSRTALSRCTRYSLASLGLFAASYLLAKFPDVPVVSQLSAVLPVGLTQRVTLIVDIGLIVAILLLARSAACTAPSYTKPAFRPS